MKALTPLLKIKSSLADYFRPKTRLVSSRIDKVSIFSTITFSDTEQILEL